MAAPSRRKHQMPSKRSGSLHRRLWEPLMSELMWSSTSTSGAVVSGAFQGEFASGSPGRGMMRKMPRRSSTLWSQLLRSLQRVSKVWVLRLLRMRIKPSHGLNLLALSAYHESKFENVALAYWYSLLMTCVIEGFETWLISFKFLKFWLLCQIVVSTWRAINLYMGCDNLVPFFSLHQWNVLYVWQMSSSYSSQVCTCSLSRNTVVVGTCFSLHVVEWLDFLRLTATCLVDYLTQGLRFSPFELLVQKEQLWEVK